MTGKKKKILIGFALFLAFLVFFLLLGITTCGTDPPVKKIVKTTEINIHFYSENKSDINNSFITDTLDIWVSNLAKVLGLNFTYNGIVTGSFNPKNSLYDRSNIYVDVSNYGEPAFHKVINQYYIKMPKSLYRDPVVLTHELAHYLTKSHFHYYVGDKKFLGCKIKKEPCLNLMNECRISSTPFTFMLTQEQSNWLNDRKGNVGQLPCQGTSMNHKYPQELVDMGIEDKITCCKKSPLSKNELIAIYKKINLQLSNREIEIHLDYFNKFMALLDENICPLELAVENAHTIYGTLDKVARNPIDVGGKILKSIDRSSLVFISVMMSKNRFDVKNYKSEAGFLGKLFNTNTLEVFRIRQNTHDHFLRTRLREEKFPDNIIAKLIPQ